MFAVIGADFDNFCMKTFHLWVQKRRPNTRCDCFRPALKDFRPTMLTRHTPSVGANLRPYDAVEIPANHVNLPKGRISYRISRVKTWDSCVQWGGWCKNMQTSTMRWFVWGSKCDPDRQKVTFQTFQWPDGIAMGMCQKNGWNPMIFWDLLFHRCLHQFFCWCPRVPWLQHVVFLFEVATRWDFLRPETISHEKTKSVGINPYKSSISGSVKSPYSSRLWMIMVDHIYLSIHLIIQYQYYQFPLI